MTQALQLSAAQIEERAARYLARKQEAQWSERDQAELEAWLRESTAHEVAYLRMEYGWAKVDRMVVLKGGVKEKSPPHPGPLGNRSMRCSTDCIPAVVPPQAGGEEVRRPYLALAALLAVAATTLFVWRGGWIDAFRYDRYTTDVGGHQTVSLTDGSRVELNTNTRVRADVTETTRAVWVDRGEAYFDIAQDPKRPFVVHAGERRITVLGTKFSVRREADRVRVVVTEGKVRMEDAAAPRIMQGGDIVTATKGLPARVEPKGTENAARELSWRQGLVTFDQTTLATAALEFNRYNRRQLVIADSAADIRIGGSFEATNLDAFVRLLEQGFGLKTAEEGGDIRVRIADQ